MAGPPPVFVTASRVRAHEVALLASSTAIGVGMLVAAPSPQSVASVLPRWLIVVWAALFVLSGAIVVGAVFWRGNMVRALFAEAAGLLFNCWPVGTASISVFVFNGSRGFLAGCFFAGWTVANVWRCVQIVREIKVLERSGMVHR